MSAPTNSQRQYMAFDSVLDRLLDVVTVMAVIADGVRDVCDALEPNTPTPDGLPAAQQDGPSGREHSSQQRAAGEVEQ